MVGKGVIVVLLLNVLAVVTIWWWRRVKHDNEMGRGVPTRSWAPLMLSFPVGGDAVLIQYLVTGEKSENVLLVGLIPGVALMLSTWIFRFPSWAIPPNIRNPRRASRDLGVYYVDETDGAETPYYVAICSCGWTSETFPDREHAQLQATTHHRPRVDPELRRPGKGKKRVASRR